MTAIPTASSNLHGSSNRQLWRRCGAAAHGAVRHRRIRVPCAVKALQQVDRFSCQQATTGGVRCAWRALRPLRQGAGRCLLLVLLLSTVLPVAQLSLLLLVPLGVLPLLLRSAIPSAAAAAAGGAMHAEDGPVAPKLVVWAAEG